MERDISVWSPVARLCKCPAGAAAWVEAGILGALGQRSQKVQDQVGAGGSDTEEEMPQLSLYL